MSRLTKYEGKMFSCNIIYCPEDCNTCVMYKAIRDKLAHYEDLEEQGRLIELPCAVGDTVWSIYKNEIYKSIATRIVKVNSIGEDLVRIETRFDITGTFHDDGRTMPYDLFGIYLSDVFLTQEEAEARLVEMEGAE